MIGKIGMFILAWVGLSFLAGGLYALVNYLDYRRRERQLKKEFTPYRKKEPRS